MRVTLHGSGRCHATAGNRSTPPVFGRPLHYDERAHVATIACFDLAGLPTVREPRGGATTDVPLAATDPEWTSAHIPLTRVPGRRGRQSAENVGHDDAGRPAAAHSWHRWSYRPGQACGESRLRGRCASRLGSGNDDRPLTGMYGATSPVASGDGEQWLNRPRTTASRGPAVPGGRKRQRAPLTPVEGCGSHGTPAAFQRGHPDGRRGRGARVATGRERRMI